MRRDARRDDDRRGGGGGGGGRDRDPHDRGDRQGGRGGGNAGERADRDEFAMQARKRSRTPPPKKREPTPDLTDVLPITERKRRLTQWDIKPPGYENVTAEQAKLSGKSDPTMLLFLAIDIRKACFLYLARLDSSLLIPANSNPLCNSLVQQQPAMLP